MKYSLVIPCYNEGAGISDLMKRCEPLLDGNIEIIFVDNGSTDNTKEIFNAYNFRSNLKITRLEKNAGYGGGILHGLTKATGNVIGWTHADLQTDPQDMLHAIKLFENENQPMFIKGKRYARPLTDTIFTVGMSFFESILLKKKLWDINAQPTLFTREIYEKFENPPTDFGLDLYAFYLARKNNILVKRFPVKFGVRRFGISHWNVDWRSKIKFIKRTLEYSLILSRKL